MKKILAIVTILGITSAAKADLLVGFDFVGYAGTETVGTSTTFDVTAVAGPSLITRGSGLTTTANADRFNAQGWDSAINATDGLASNDFFEFTVTPNIGFSLSFTNLSFNFQRSATGASNIAIRASFDSFASDLGVTNNFANGGTTTILSMNTTGVGGLQSQSAAITFRVIGFTGTSGGSTGFEGTGNDIAITGTSVAVPEPASAAMLGIAAGLVYIMRRKNKAMAS